MHNYIGDDAANIAGDIDRCEAELKDIFDECMSYLDCIDDKQLCLCSFEAESKPENKNQNMNRPMHSGTPSSTKSCPDGTVRQLTSCLKGSRAKKNYETHLRLATSLVQMVCTTAEHQPRLAQLAHMPQHAHTPILCVKTIPIL